MAKRQRTVSRGWPNHIPVVDSDGDRIGWAAADQVDDDALSIESGLLFPTKVRVPRAWIASATPERITLSKTRRHVEKQREIAETRPFRRPDH